MQLKNIIQYTLITRNGGLTSPSGDSFAHSNEKTSPTETNVPKVLVDSEGYSIPPSSDKPWETFSSTDGNDSDARSEDASSSLSAQEKMRVEIKQSTITEENEADAAALSSVVTALKLRHNLTTRGKRDQWRMTNSQSSDNIYGNYISPQRTNSVPINESNGSTRPLSEFSSNNVSHTKFVTEPEIKKYELSASITETLNVITKDGEITKFLLTGEISFSHNLSMVYDANNYPPLRVRIKNLENLENFVPNLSVFKPIADKLGEYEVDIGSLFSTDNFPVVVMKYQVHIDPDDRSKFIPLHVHPWWKCEPNVTLIAISYHPNSECKLSGVLSELSFIIPVDGNVDIVQSKPISIWSKKQKRICWQVDDIDLSAISEKKTILARLEANQKSEPAPTAVNFKCKGRLFSDISIETVSLSNGNGNIKGDYFNHNKNIIINFNKVICQAISGKFLASS
ncbi:12173_t:CDS:2 [Entrophospora sp. SA101]|nr:12173_t:CDS:2 [Entrophospora sp. SA101]